MKKCYQCQVYKVYTAFHANKTKADGLRGICIICHKSNGITPAVRISASKYRKNHKLLYPWQDAQHTAARKARKIKATPKWANLKCISCIYSTAAQLRKDGKPVQVDHVIPLKSLLVCGLHCEANLEIILKADNQSKNNKWWPDMW